MSLSFDATSPDRPATSHATSRAHAHDVDTAHGTVPAIGAWAPGTEAPASFAATFPFKSRLYRRDFFAAVARLSGNGGRCGMTDETVRLVLPTKGACPVLSLRAE